MAVSNDVLVTALQELLPGLTESWTLFHPAFDAIVKKGNKRTVNHPFVEFVVLPEGPGTVTSIINGDEHIAGGRRQSAVKGSAYGATMIYAFDVPGEDLRMANGPADVAELIKKYPEAALWDFEERIARQLVMGDGAQVGQFFTMNGDTTYNPKATGAQQGMLEFQAASAQTSTRFGIVSNSITNWHNQHAHTTSMGADGLRKIRQAYWDASQQGGNMGMSCDVMLADRDSYDNIVAELETFVQFVNREKDVKQGDPVPGRLREGIKMVQGELYPEPQIDRSLFATPDATEGIIYGLCSETLKLFTQGSGSKTTGGDFELRDVGRLPYQELFRTEYVLSMGAYCTDLRRNFTVTGTANP
jgi:hypothetical protein